MNVLRLATRNSSRTAVSHKQSTRFSAEKSIEEEFKQSIQQEHSQLDREAWTKIRNGILKHRFYSKVNVDATILGLCSKHGSLEVGQSYMQFLEASQTPMTAAIAGKYLKLFSLPIGQKCLDEKQSEEVVRICREIRARYPVLDGNTTENLVHALSLTELWREAIDLLNQSKEFGQPSHSAFNDIAQAAFRHGDMELGVATLSDGISAGRLPSGQSLITWISNANNLEDVLVFIQNHTLQVPERVATSLKRALESNNVTVHMSSVSRNKTCSSCRTTLDDIHLDPKEFTQLQAAFHERVIVKDNIFIKSTPEEFNEFQTFLEKRGPFDVIIDGLNVAYSVGANRPINYLSGHVGKVCY